MVAFIFSLLTTGAGFAGAALDQDALCIGGAVITISGESIKV